MFWYPRVMILNFSCRMEEYLFYLKFSKTPKIDQLLNGTSTLVSFCSKLLFALKMDPDLVKKIIFLFAKVMSNEDDEEVSGFAIQAVNHLLFAYKSHIHEIKKWTIDSGLLHQLLMTLKRLFSHFHFIYSYICI